MDWPSLILGAFLGVVLQNITYPLADERIRDYRRRLRHRATNRAWQAVEGYFPSLRLVQAGWDRDGFFAPESILFRLDGEFVLADPELRRIRRDHQDEWIRANKKNEEQAGISSIDIFRENDDPAQEPTGRDHSIQIKMHRYQWFDFLATHRRRLEGSDREMGIIDRKAEPIKFGQPIRAFPNPCSLGYSVFCENGDYLATARRTKNEAAGGDWQGGKMYNLVGENVNPRDFLLEADGSLRSNPLIATRRALYEEVGLSLDELANFDIRLHSLAWASDILDLKFFGVLIAPLSREELQAKWRGAPDVREFEGPNITFWRVASSKDCAYLLKSINRNRDDWAPEAIFATIRSLLALGRTSPATVIRSLAG